jgi:AcrR family transcriptional regulator
MFQQPQYHYFASKDELMQAIIEHHSPVQGIRALLPEMLDLPPEALVRMLVKNMLAIAEGEPFLQLVRVCLPELIYNPDVAPFGLATLHEATAFLETYLARRSTQGELRPIDPALVAQVLMGSITGIVVRRHIFRDPMALRYSQEQIVESIVTTMLHGLLNQ